MLDGFFIFENATDITYSTFVSKFKCFWTNGHFASPISIWFKTTTRTQKRTEDLVRRNAWWTRWNSLQRHLLFELLLRRSRAYFSTQEF